MTISHSDSEGDGLRDAKRIMRDVRNSITKIWNFLHSSRDLNEVHHWYKDGVFAYHDLFMKARDEVNRQVLSVREDLNKITDSTENLGEKLAVCKNIMLIESKKNKEFERKYTAYNRRIDKEIKKKEEELKSRGYL